MSLCSTLFCFSKRIFTLVFFCFFSLKWDDRRSDFWTRLLGFYWVSVWRSTRVTFTFGPPISDENFSSSSAAATKCPLCRSGCCAEFLPCSRAVFFFFTFYRVRERERERERESERVMEGRGLDAISLAARKGAYGRLDFLFIHFPLSLSLSLALFRSSIGEKKKEKEPKKIK